MVSGIFVLLGVLIGGLITWGIQYYFRREERKWEERTEKKKAGIECMEILHKILEFYDTFPQTSENEAYFERVNENVRKCRVKLKVLFGSDHTKIIESFEDANRTLKRFIAVEDGERIKIGKKSREKIKEFGNLLIDYFQ